MLRSVSLHYNTIYVSYTRMCYHPKWTGVDSCEIQPKKWHVVKRRCSYMSVWKCMAAGLSIRRKAIWFMAYLVSRIYHLAHPLLSPMQGMPLHSLLTPVCYFVTYSPLVAITWNVAGGHLLLNTCLSYCVSLINEGSLQCLPCYQLDSKVSKV